MQGTGPFRGQCRPERTCRDVTGRPLLEKDSILLSADDVARPMEAVTPQSESLYAPESAASNEIRCRFLRAVSIDLLSKILWRLLVLQ